MPYMKKLNRVMMVPDSEVEHYSRNGYTLYETAIPQPATAHQSEPDERPARTRRKTEE